MNKLPNRLSALSSMHNLTSAQNRNLCATTSTNRWGRATSLLSSQFMKHLSLLLLLLVMGVGSVWGDTTLLTYTTTSTAPTAKTDITAGSGKVQAGSGFTPDGTSYGWKLGGDPTTSKTNSKYVLLKLASGTTFAQGDVISLSGYTSTTPSNDKPQGFIFYSADGGSSLEQYGQATITSGSKTLTNLTFTVPENSTLIGKQEVYVFRNTSYSVYFTGVTITRSSSSIAVKTAPTKTTYTAGEYFDPTGLVITKTMSDASTSDVSYADESDNFTFNPTTSTALTTGNTFVTITYGGQSTSQAITVNAIHSESDLTPISSAWTFAPTCTQGTNWSNALVGNGVENYVLLRNNYAGNTNTAGAVCEANKNIVFKLASGTKWQAHAVTVHNESRYLVVGTSNSSTLSDYSISVASSTQGSQVDDYFFELDGNQTYYLGGRDASSKNTVYVKHITFTPMLDTPSFTLDTNGTITINNKVEGATYYVNTTGETPNGSNAIALTFNNKTSTNVFANGVYQVDKVVVLVHKEGYVDAVAKNDSEVTVANTNPTDIGRDDFSTGFNTVHSGIYGVSKGMSRELTFVNHAQTTTYSENYKNWGIFFQTGSSSLNDGYICQLNCLPQVWVGGSATDTHIYLGSNGTEVSNWEQFRTDMQNATVTVKVTLNNAGTELSMYATMEANGRTYIYPYTKTIDAAENIYTYFTVENSYITGFTAGEPVAAGEAAPQRSDYESWLIGGSQTNTNSDFKGDKITLPGTYNPGASASLFTFSGESSTTRYVKIRTTQSLLTNTSEKGFVIKVNNGTVIDDICIYGTSNYSEVVNITGYRVDGGAVQTLYDEQLVATGGVAHAVKINGISAKNTIEFICSGAGQIIAAVGVNYTDGTALTGLSLSPSSIDSYVGEKQQLTVSYTPNEPTNKLVTWSSDNPSVATVSATGLVTMVGAGTATITVTSVADGAITKTANVTVQNKKDLTVTTKYDNIVMQAGKTSASYTPEFTVKDGETTLTKGEGYTVEYSMVDESGSNPISENAGVFSPNGTTANNQHTVTVTATIKPTSPAYNQATAQFKFIVYPTSAGYNGADLAVGTTWEYTPYPYPGNTRYIGVERGSEDKIGYLYVRDADYKNSGLWTKWQGTNDANDCRIRFKVTATTEQPVKVTVTSNSVSGRYMALGKHTGSGNYTTIAHGTAGAATHVFTITETGEYGIAGANTSDGNEYNGSDLYLQKIVLARVATIVAPQFTVAADGTVSITNLSSYSDTEGLSFYINTNGMTPGFDVPYSYFMTNNTYKLPNGTYPAGRLVVTAVKGESDKTTVSTQEYTVTGSSVTVPTVTSIKIGGLTSKRVYVSGTGNTWPNLLTTLNEETHTYETGLRFYGDPSIVVTLSDGTTAPIDRSEELDGIANTSTAYFVLGSVKYAITYAKATVATAALTEQASAKTWKFKDMFGENGFYIINSVTNNNMTIFASENNSIEYGGGGNGDMEFVGAGTIRERSFAVSVPQGMSEIIIAGNPNGERTINVYTKEGDKKIGSIKIFKEASTHEVSYIYKGNATTLYFAVDANDISNLRYFKIEPYKYFNYEIVPSEFVMETGSENGKWGATKGKNPGGQKSKDGFFTLTKDLDLQDGRLHATYTRFDGKTIEEANQKVLNFGGGGYDSSNWSPGRRSIEFTPKAHGQLHVYVHSTAYVDNGDDIAVRSLVLRDNETNNRGEKTGFTGQTGNFMSMLNCAKADADGTIIEVIYNCKAGRKYSLASCSSGLYVFYMGYHEDTENAYAFSEFETIAAPEVTSKPLSGISRSIVVTQAAEPAGGKHKYNTHVNIRDHKSQVDCENGGFYPSSTDAKNDWIAANADYIEENAVNVPEDKKTATQKYEYLPSEIKTPLDDGFKEAGDAGKKKSWCSIGSPTAENLIYKEDNEHLIVDITKDFYIRCVTINATNNSLMREKLESGNYLGKRNAPAKEAGLKKAIAVASDGNSPIYDSKFVDYMVCAAPTISDLKVTYDPFSKRSDLEANPNDEIFSDKQITYLVVPIIQQGVTTNNSTTLTDYVTEGVASKEYANVGGVTEFLSRDIKTVADGGSTTTAAAVWNTVDDNDASLAGIQNSVDLAAFKGGDKLMIIAVSKLSKDGDAVYSYATSRVITIETLKTPVITVNGGVAITSPTTIPVLSTIATTYETVEEGAGVVDTKNNVRAFYTTDGSDPVIVKSGSVYIAGNSSTTMYDPSDVSNTQPKLRQTGVIKAMNVNIQTGETSKIVAANVMIAPPTTPENVGIIPDVQVINFKDGKVNKEAKFNDYLENDCGNQYTDGQTDYLGKSGYDRSSKATFLFYENSNVLASARATISEKLQFSVDNETFAHAESSQNVLAFQAYAGSLVKIVAAGNMGNTVSLGYSENGNGTWTQVGNFAVQGDGPVTYYVRIPEDASPGDKQAYYIRRDFANTNIYYVGVYHTEHENWNQWTFSQNYLQGSWGNNDSNANTTGIWGYNASLPQHSTYRIVSSIDESKSAINLTPYTEPTLERHQGVLVSMVAPKQNEAYYVNETLVRGDKVKDMANAADNDFASSELPKNYFQGYTDAEVHKNPYNRQAMVWSWHGYKLDKSTGAAIEENGQKVYEKGQRFYFYAKGSKFTRNKCYIVLSKSYPVGSGQSNVSSYRAIYDDEPIDFGNGNNDDEPTIIDEVETTDDEVEEVNSHSFRNGIYTLSGQRISEVTKTGIYIVNGKKMMIKK